MGSGLSVPAMMGGPLKTFVGWPICHWPRRCNRKPGKERRDRGKLVEMGVHDRDHIRVGLRDYPSKTAPQTPEALKILRMFICSPIAQKIRLNGAIGYYMFVLQSTSLSFQR
jgi:hypothetical protein